MIGERFHFMGPKKKTIVDLLLSITPLLNYNQNPFQQNSVYLQTMPFWTIQLIFFYVYLTVLKVLASGHSSLMSLYDFWVMSAQSILSARFSVQSSELDPPSRTRECCSPPLGQRGRHTRLRVKGWGGGTQFRWRDRHSSTSLYSVQNVDM
jgi:hypothetical protein